MKYICYIPPISTTVNLTSDPTAAAMLADPYDEIILAYPQIVGGDMNAVRLSNQILQLLTGHSVWIAPNVLWPALSGLTPLGAYTAAIENTLADMQAFWNMIPYRFQSMVKGFAFDHVDLYRMFGNYNNQNTDPTTYKNLDRYYTNSMIQFAHVNFNRAAMLITNKASDILANVYRYDDASPKFPGAAKWPTLLGQDSSFNDWIVSRDVFYTPAVNKSSMDQDYTPGPASKFQFANGTLGSWWRFFENLPILLKYQTGNLSIGILQHLDFSAETMDYSLSPNLTAQQQSFISGMTLFLTLTGIDGQCFVPIPASGQGCFIPDFASATTPASVTSNASSISSSTATSGLPPQSTPARFFSTNNCIYADYMSGNLPIRIVTDSIFSFFNVVEPASASQPLL